VVDIGEGNKRLFVTATHEGRGNFIVHALDKDTQDLEGVVNEIGTYSGTSALVTFSEPDDVRYLQVKADGNWTLELVDVRSLQKVGNPFSGSGTTVLIYDGPGGIFTITHDGESNFIVHVTGDGLINEIGAYSGRVPMPAGPSVIEITADGNWTFTKS